MSIMANTSSAKKAMRSALKKRAFNNAKENKIKEALKGFKKSVATGSKDMEKKLSSVFSAMDKAVKTRFLSKNTVARKKSRLVAMMRKSAK